MFENVQFMVNGEPVVVPTSPDITLLRFLREDFSGYYG